MNKNCSFLIIKILEFIEFSLFLRLQFTRALNERPTTQYPAVRPEYFIVVSSLADQPGPDDLHRR